MSQPLKISGRISIELSDAQRKRSSKSPQKVLLFSALSSALPGSPPTPWPPRIAESDLEDGVSFRKLKSGSIRTSPKPAVQRARARAPSVLGVNRFTCSVCTEPVWPPCASTPLGCCPLCFTTPCPHLLSRVDFLWDRELPGLRQASDQPLRLSCF